MIRELEKNAPLRPLSPSVEAGYAICFWEKLVRHVPDGEAGNPCTICRARVGVNLREHFHALVRLPLPKIPCQVEETASR